MNYQSIQDIRKSDEYRKTYNELFKGCQIVVSAPVGFFWAGEHNVKHGGPAVIQHVPLRVYIGLEMNNSEITFDKYREFDRMESDFKKTPPQMRPLLWRDKQNAIIKIIKNSGIKSNATIHVFSELSSGCGANWAGTFSAALATAILSLPNLDKARASIGEWAKMASDSLPKDSFFSKCLNLGWQIENVLNPYASGRAVFFSMVSTALPILYMKDPGNRNFCSFSFKELGIIDEAQYDINEDFPLSVSLIYTGVPKNLDKKDEIRASLMNLGTVFENFEKLIKGKMPLSQMKGFSYIPDMTRAIKGHKSHPYIWPITANAIEQIGTMAELFGSGSSSQTKKIIERQAGSMRNNQKYQEFLGMGWTEASQVEAFLNGILKRESNSFGFKLTGGGTGGYVVCTFPNEPKLVKRLSEDFYEPKNRKELPEAANIDWISAIDGFEKDGVRIEDISDIQPRAAKQPKKNTKEIEAIRRYANGKDWKEVKLIFTKKNRLLVYISTVNPVKGSLSCEQLNLHNLNLKGADKKPMPLEAWKILQELSEDRSGALSLKRLDNDRTLLEQHISQLRETLCNIFGIDDKYPIDPKERDKPYHLNFTLLSQKKVLDTPEPLRTAEED